MTTKEMNEHDLNVLCCGLIESALQRRHESKMQEVYDASAELRRKLGL